MGGGDGVHAIIVADCISPHSVLHQLTNAYKDTPLALLPICNRPIIDYVIENLVQNEIRRITVLCASHVSQVEEHVGNIKLALEDQQRRNVMGLDSDTQSITISCKTSPSGKLKTIENVLDALRESLLGSEPFVLVPIDCISNISNIKPLFERHIARADAAKMAGGDPVVFTAVVQRDDRTLRHALNALMKGHQNYPDFTPDLLQPDSNSSLMVPGGHSDYVNETSMLTDNGGVEADGLLDDVQEARRTEYLWGDSDDDQQEPPYLMESTSSGSGVGGGMIGASVGGEVGSDSHMAALPRVTVAFEPTSQIAFGFQVWHEDESSPSIPLPKVKPGQRLVIRSDLVISGLMICSPGVIGASTGPPTSVVSLMYDLVVNYEAKKNRFAIDYANEDSIVLPVTSLQSYILANRAVGNRLLYPLTREAVFVGDNDDHTRYVVAMSSNHVTLRKDFLPIAVGIGGCCTLGGGIRVERESTSNTTSPTSAQAASNACSALVQESIIGDGVVLGNGCAVIGSVVLPGARIGDHITIINSVIGENAYVGVAAHNGVDHDDDDATFYDDARVQCSVVAENSTVHLEGGTCSTGQLLLTSNSSTCKGAPILAPTGVISTQGMLLADIKTSFEEDTDSRWLRVIKDNIDLYIDKEDPTQEWIEEIFVKSFWERHLELNKTTQDLISCVMHQLIIVASERQQALREGGAGAIGAQNILNIPESEIDELVKDNKGLFDDGASSDDGSDEAPKGGMFADSGSDVSSEKSSSSASSSSSSSSSSEAKSADEDDSDDSEKASTTRTAPPSEAVQLIKRLLCMWYSPVLCKFAPMFTEEDEDAICKGIALGIEGSGDGLTTDDANKIIGLLYSNLSSYLFEQQGYCLVPGDRLLQFDDDIAYESDKRVVEGWNRAGTCIAKIRAIVPHDTISTATSSSSSSDGTGDDDSSEDD